jgi:subtilisin family serine protease
MRRFLLLLAIAFAAGAAPSAAQLPDVGQTVGGILDNAPNTVGNVENTARDLTGVDVSELRRARQNQIRDLLRRHRNVLEADPTGAPVIRREVLAVAPSEASLAAARALGFTAVDTISAGALELEIVVLRAPEGMSTRRAIEALRRADPAGAYDYNHIYLGVGPTEAAPRPTRQSSSDGGGRARIGLIDSGVDAAHPALTGVSVRQRGFAASEALADTHGTAIASLLAGADRAFRGAAPGASVYVADVYGGRPSGGGAAAIVAALNWLAQSNVGVINISLVGPANRALEAAVRAAIARGHIVVAAVGNDGPSAPPLYPAAYPGVVGVTGVDARNRALPEAGRGPQVDFAAPGSDMAAAAPGGRYIPVRGTSFAAPVVAGLLAQRLHGPDAAAASRAPRDLARNAVDLGPRGQDRTFGLGLVGADLRESTRSAARR